MPKKREPDATQMIERRLLTPRETAHYLNISIRSIYNQSAPKARKRFPIRPRRVGRCLRFDKKEIDAFLDSRGTDE